MRGGVAGGSSVRLGRKYPVASPGPVGPFEEEPRIRRGGLRYMYVCMYVCMYAWMYVCMYVCMYCCCCCCEGTQHVPAGEIARYALPGQGAREQSAGVTLAGRVPTTTEGGGGGGGRGLGGGGGVEKGGATCGSHPGALSRLAGGGSAMGIVTQWAIRLQTSDFYGPSPPTPSTQAPHDRPPPPPSNIRLVDKWKMGKYGTSENVQHATWGKA